MDMNAAIGIDIGHLQCIVSLCRDLLAGHDPPVGRQVDAVRAEETDGHQQQGEAGGDACRVDGKGEGALKVPNELKRGHGERQAAGEAPKDEDGLDVFPAEHPDHFRLQLAAMGAGDGFDSAFERHLEVSAGFNSRGLPGGFGTQAVHGGRTADTVTPHGVEVFGAATPARHRTNRGRPEIGGKVLEVDEHRELQLRVARRF
jgi:hypothetical protein